MFKEIFLGDDKYFYIFIGNRVKKIEVFNKKGEIPLYSANVIEPFGWLNKSNVDTFEYNHILWAIDNSNFHYNIKRKGEKFATTDHCGAIRILDERIIPEYIFYQLDIAKNIHGFDRTLRPSLENVRRLKIVVPIDKDGNIDYQKQKEMVNNYNSYKDKKSEISNMISELQSSYLEISYNMKRKKIYRLEEIFDLTITTNKSFFTKKFVNDNKGNIPVYSASKNKNDIGYGYVKDNLPGVKYFEDCMTWNIDGSVGKVHIREGKFSLSEKVIPLIVKEEFKDKIDYRYIKYVIEKEAIKCGFSFSNKAGKSRIKDIPIEMPLNNNDEIDLIQQKEIANRYNLHNERLKKIISDLQDLIDTKISFDL